MSGTENKEEIVIESDEEVSAPEVVVEAQPQPQDNVQESLEQLRRQLESERSARLAAERQAQEASRREYDARNQTEDANLQLVKTAITTVKANNDVLRSNYAAAMQAGDYDAAAQIQEEMASNSAKLLQLENGRAAMEERPRQQAPEPVSDPVEKLASQLTPRSAEWIRKNPQFATDNRLFQKMVAAHNLAVADGIAPDTDEYFSEVENILRIKPAAAKPAPVEEDPTTQAAQVTQRRVSPAAAPVSRGNTQTTRVRLTEEEREMASLMKMTPEEYAKNKLELKKTGKIN